MMKWLRWLVVMVVCAAAAPVFAQGDDVVDLTFFRDADSITIFVAEQGTVSLVGLGVGFNRGDDAVNLALSNYRSFADLPFDALSTPMCLRLERNGSDTPLPNDCPSANTTIQRLNIADVFWFDSLANVELTFNISRAGESLATCSAGQVRCDVPYDGFTGVVPSTEIVPAADGEIVVLVSQFKRDNTERSAEQFVVNTLNAAAAEVGENIRVERLDFVIDGREEARQIGALWDATMVIFGTIVGDEGGISTSYEIIPSLETPLSQDILVSSAQLDNYDLFFFEGQDADYAFGLMTGQLYYFEQRYDEALTAFQLAESALDKTRMRQLSAGALFFYQGVIYTERGDAQTGLTYFTRSLEVDDSRAVAYYNRGTVHADMGDLAAAIADYDQAIALNPQYAEAYNNRGVARADMGDLVTAIADYDQAIALNPQDAVAYYNRGVAHADMGDLSVAIADFDQATALNPQYAEAFYNRGLAHRDMGDLDAAIADFDQAIALNPQLAEAYNNRGFARLQLNQFDLAIKDATRALAIDPNFANAYLLRGFSYDVQGNSDAALSDLRQYLALAGSNAPDFVRNRVAELEAQSSG